MQNKFTFAQKQFNNATITYIFATATPTQVAI